MYLSWMIRLTLISEVLIISMLMPSWESDSNMRQATPAWVRIPMPTTETLAMSELVWMLSG